MPRAPTFHRRAQSCGGGVWCLIHSERAGKGTHVAQAAAISETPLFSPSPPPHVLVSPCVWCKGQSRPGAWARSWWRCPAPAGLGAGSGAGGDGAVLSPACHLRPCLLRTLVGGRPRRPPLRQLLRRVLRGERLRWGRAALPGLDGSSSRCPGSRARGLSSLAGAALGEGGRARSSALCSHVTGQGPAHSWVLC